MSQSSVEFHQIWIEQCAATEDIREQFGTKNALDYLIGEKLFTFVEAAEKDPDFAGELPAFVAAIQRLFSAEDIRAYLDHLERTKFLAPPEPEMEIEDDEEERDDEPWWAHPVLSAQELLRFSRIRQLLQPQSQRRKNMTKPSKVLRNDDHIRKHVHPDEKVPLTLSPRERELILEHTFADDELTAPLGVVPASNKASVYSFTLADLEELIGYVAAEGNHAKDKKLQKELDRLFERMQTVLESYTDEEDRTTE